MRDPFFAFPSIARPTILVHVNQALTLWILCDGKPGHENQSLGLAEAIGRQTACNVHRIPCRPWRNALKIAASLPKPDWILGAGHSTHGLLWWLSLRYQAKSVVLMRPSLPGWLFDRIIAPEHDFKNGHPADGRVLTTRGALNRVAPPVDAERQGSLILLGGPSRHHGWDAAAMETMLRQIANHTPVLEAADSRRTPAGFFDSLDFITRRHFHHQTPADWLAGRIVHAEEIWVTEDSVSMIYEALTSGARVGLLPVPRLRPQARIIQGVDRLIDQGWLTPYAEWEKSGTLRQPPETLAEAERAADWILEK